jgi:hypothetical protein
MHTVVSNAQNNFKTEARTTADLDARVVFQSSMAG